MSYGSLFGRSTTEARHDNWTSYFDFIRKTSGELLEADKDLTQKREAAQAAVGASGSHAPATCFRGGLLPQLRQAAR
jgi:hypothetical protein